jgi:sec-independent protein translocase protein TatB
MPTIGWFEILIIVTVAILVVGPKDFPIMLKKMGSWFGSIKRYVSDVQNQVSELDDIEINDDTKINQNQKSNKDEDEQKK